MLSRKNRFHGSKDLRYVQQHGSSVRSQYFLFKSLKNPKRSDYRLAVVVSRKVHKSAVARNRIRRRLYATFRENETYISQPHDIVLTVFSADVIDLPPEVLTKLVQKQLVSAGLSSSK